jgi:phage shock protein PspC (stress-responsive transcriptional regulator)
MRRVVTISLNGIAYQLEEAGYDALRRYLDEAETRLRADPDCSEILADLEQAIGEKCARCLDAHRNVVSTEDVQRILAEMGPVEGGQGADAAGAAGSTADGAGSAAAGSGATAAGGGPGAAPKRLYQISEGALISGVCNGLGAYLGIDVVVVRVIFVALALLTWGAWILVYLVLMFVIPYASTSEDRAAAHGLPFTAQQLVRQAKRQYAEFKENAERRHRSHREWRWQRREWKQQWRQQRWAMRHHMHWGEPPSGEAPGYATQLLAGVLVPIAALINAALVIALLIGIAQLLSRGTIFGWARPPGMPLWVGIVVLCIVYGALSSPLRAVRHAAYFARGAGPSAWAALWGSLLWLAFMALFLWMAWHFWPQLQHVLQQLGDSLRATHASGQAIHWLPT